MGVRLEYDELQNGWNPQEKGGNNKGLRKIFFCNQRYQPEVSFLNIISLGKHRKIVAMEISQN